MLQAQRDARPSVVELFVCDTKELFECRQNGKTVDVQLFITRYVVVIVLKIFKKQKYFLQAKNN